MLAQKKFKKGKKKHTNAYAYLFWISIFQCYVDWRHFSSCYQPLFGLLCVGKPGWKSAEPYCSCQPATASNCGFKFQANQFKNIIDLIFLSF